MVRRVHVKFVEEGLFKVVATVVVVRETPRVSILSPHLFFLDGTQCQ